MTDKVFTFTAEQIKDIYRAGIRRGEDVQSSYEWGTTPSGEEFDELFIAVYDIVNEGVGLFDDNHINFSVVEGWFKESK